MTFSQLKPYQPVYWVYTHAVGANRFKRVKRGEYLAPARKRRSGRLVQSRTHARVQFEGNRTVSIIPVRELKEFIL